MRAAPAAPRGLLRRLLALPRGAYLLPAVALVVGLLVGGRQDFAVGLFPYPWSYLAHVLTYGALAALLWLADGGRRPWGVVLVVGLVGLADEAHQSLLDGRRGSAMDLAADLAGALLAVGGLEVWRRAARARRPERPDLK